MESPFYFLDLINEINMYDTSICIVIYKGNRRKEHFFISNIMCNYIS